MTGKVKMLLADPTVSFWLKKALKENLDRDPVDTVRDARLLLDVLNERCKLIIGGDNADDTR